MYQEGDVEGMKNILKEYSRNFSKNTTEQDKMVASLLSVYEKKKQNGKGRYSKQIVDKCFGKKRTHDRSPVPDRTANCKRISKTDIVKNALIGSSGKKI